MNNELFKKKQQMVTENGQKGLKGSKEHYLGYFVNNAWFVWFSLVDSIRTGFWLVDFMRIVFWFV